MLSQFLVGTAVGLVNIMIHSMVMLGIVGLVGARRADPRPFSSFEIVGVMITTVLILMIAHGREVFVWAAANAIVGAASAESDFVYFS